MREVDKIILDGIPKPNRVVAPVMWYGGKGNTTQHASRTEVLWVKANEGSLFTMENA